MLRDRGIDQFLATRPAIAVERIAAGGGDTAWYRLDRPQDLETLVVHLRPASDLRFAFGDAFAEGPFDTEMADLVDQIASEEINAVILARGDDFELHHDFPSSAAEAAQFVNESAPAGRVWVGRFPGGHSDGERAVQLELPDVDGVQRPYPH